MRTRKRGVRGAEGGSARPALVALTCLLGTGATTAGAAEPAILAVGPRPGTTHEAVDALSLAVDLSRTAILTTFGFGVTLDGCDVTPACRLSATRDVPPSRVEVACRLERLAVGEHRAEVSLRPATAPAWASAWSFAWSFSVAGR